MGLRTKIFILQVLLSINCVLGMCPYAQKFYDESDDNDIQPTYDTHILSSMSYNTYETECHRFVEQPPAISDNIIYHAMSKAVERTERYVLLDVEEASGVVAPKFLTDMDRNNFYFESATKYVQENTCSSKTTTTVYLSTIELEQYLSENKNKEICEIGQIQYETCSSESLYRNVDGTCNSVERPSDGSVGDCMGRLIPPDYKDGISQLKLSIDGSPLPNARLISLNLLGQDGDRPTSARYTQLQAFFGEFVIGDNAATLNHATRMLVNLQCCDHEEHVRSDHPQCAGFFILPDDVLHETYPNQTCMPFIRSIPCARCKLGPRAISNAITAAQDLNSVYGVSISMLHDRRTMVDGCLKSEIKNGHEIFAVERINANGRYRCFKDKCEPSPLDIRNLFAPTGLAWALLFHRNHNRHARNLATLHPDWKDEEIFQAARKWNIAEYQHCVYNEYLETLIGSELTEYYRILPAPIGHFSSYEPSVQLKAIVEFQSTAGRHGHAALSEDIFIIIPKTGQEFKINLRKSEMFEEIFNDGFVDGMFLAQMSRPAFETTPSVPLKTFLNDAPGRTFGMDLGALDMQRQRDHGIAGYVHYIKYCHNVEANDWEDLQQFIDWDDIEKIKQIYNYVEDIELYIGGHYERKAHDALVGPTFGCIIGIQFHNAKYGDRFFYEHGDQISSFSLEQLYEIKTKSSFASILCKNTELDEVLSDPLRIISETNHFVSCSEFDDIDLIEFIK